MDTPGHGFWSALLFWWTGQPILAALFGMLPDLLSFFPVTVYAFFRKDTWKKGFLESYKNFHPFVKKYAENMYKPTHSLFVAALLCVIVLAVWPGSWWVLAFPLHIIVDIPTHTKKFYPTPFAWPLSNYVYDGISWARPVFMIPHYTLLVIGWAWLLLH